MLPQISTTRCTVDVIAPNGSKATFRSNDPEGDLLSVETTKDLGAACGSFTLHLAPGTDRQGRSWEQVIPRRSLVFISMERPGATGMPEVHPTVMLGLTDDHSRQELYAEATPHRRVQVHGREISCVIVDAVLWFNMALQHHPELGTLTLHSLDGTLQQVAVTYNPNIAHAMEDPREILSRILDVYLFVGGEALGIPAGTPGIQHPVISLDFPAITLKDLLQKNKSAWGLFEDGVTVPVVQFPQASGSLWNFLHVFIDRHFQEFFTRIEDGFCQIHFRGKPFAHRLIRAGTRFKTADQEPTLRTVRLDPADLQTLSVRMETSQVLNVFQAGPRGIDALYEIPGYNTTILPQVVKEAWHPSFVGRYGLRVLQAESMYLAPFQRASTAGPAPQPLTPAPAGAKDWADTTNQIAAAHGLPAIHRPYFVALIHQESYFNRNATHKNSDGSVDEGIAQFHKPYPVGVTLSDPFDPIEALGAAAQYWNILRTYPWIGDDPIQIVAAYNGGPAGIRNGFSPAVARHVASVRALVPQYAHYAGATGFPGSPPTAPPAGQPSGNIEEMVRTAQRWAAILRAWYDMGGELFSGTLTVRGHPAWNIGDRLLSTDQRGEWEAYIEGVSHQFDMRSGQYLTQLRITRGWYLSEAIAQEIVQDGQTTVAETSGGPPTIDPETGEIIDGSGKEVLITHASFGSDPLMPIEEFHRLEGE